MQSPAAELGLLDMPDDVIVTIVRLTRPFDRRTLLILELANTCRRFMRMFPRLAFCLFGMPTVGRLTELVGEHYAAVGYMHGPRQSQLQKTLTRLVCRYVKGARVVTLESYEYYDINYGTRTAFARPGRSDAARVCISNPPTEPQLIQYDIYVETMRAETARYLQTWHGKPDD